MTDQKELTEIYRQNLEKNIIEYIAQKKEISLEHAMNIYYKSALSEQISEGRFGIDNLDHKYLAQDLMENEPELFSTI